MLDALSLIKDNLYFTWLAMFIFFAGFCFSYIVYEFNMEFLLKFPRWFMHTLSKFIDPGKSFIAIFLIIFLFNSISIMFYMISGLFIIFPYIIAFMTGMNIGLSVFIPPALDLKGYESISIRSHVKILKAMLFSTLVLFLEVSVFSISLGMGMSLASAASTITNDSFASALFLSEVLSVRMSAYTTICVPLLMISAWLEANVIKGLV
jgi:hypothetical protein